jgi:hypothetical protein
MDISLLQDPCCYLLDIYTLDLIALVDFLIRFLVFRIPVNFFEKLGIDH